MMEASKISMLVTYNTVFKILFRDTISNHKDRTFLISIRFIIIKI